MNQIQIQDERKKIKTLDRARIIATSKHVRRCDANRKIWCVQSENQCTPSKFYRVMYDDDLEDFVCDCKAFEFNFGNACKHICAYAVFEGSNA